MTDSSQDLYKYGPTNAVLDLLEASANLVQLEVSCLYLSTGRLYELLRKSTLLKSIKIHYCREARVISHGRVKALCDSNCTLCAVEIRDGRGQMVPAHLGDQLNYYLALNLSRCTKFIRAETSSITIVVELLVELAAMEESRSERRGMALALRYGLLRENPALWSRVYNKIVEEEDSLSHAVGSLSLLRQLRSSLSYWVWGINVCAYGELRTS